MSDVVLPLPRLLATPALEPLIESVARRLLRTSHACLGGWLRALDAADQPRLQ